MALQGVPWAVGYSKGEDGSGRPIGAHNAVEGARRALFDATGGARGVTGPTDMEVTALPVPGPAVRVHAGSCKTPNDYLPAGGAQSYSGWEMSSTDVPVTTTGSSGSRINFLVYRVDDPTYAGPEPDDVVNGPYNRYVWLSSDPRTSPPAFPHVPLVRLDQPANTSTITNDMLTDIREVANPRRAEFLFARPRVHADEGPATELRTLQSSGGEYFPGGDGFENLAHYVIPAWATQMVIEADWLGVRYAGGRTLTGAHWIEFGDEYRNRTWPGNRQWEFATQMFAHNNADSGDASRTNWRVMDSVWVPPKLRGKRTTFCFKAGMFPNTQFGVSMDYLGGLGLRVTCVEVAESRHAV